MRLPSLLPGLRFGAATSDVLLTPAHSSVNNLKTFTTLQLVNVTTLTASRILWGKRPGSANRMFRLPDTSGNVSLTIRRTGGALTYTTSDTPLLQTGTLRWLATTYDDALTSSAAHIYHGLYGSALVEAIYGTATNGTGASDASDSANGWAWFNGQVSPYSAAMQGVGYVAVLWPRVLSLHDLNEVVAGRIAVSGAVVAYASGAQGSVAAVDLSGSGNHGTITGAVLSGEPLLTDLDTPRAVRWKRALFPPAGGNLLRRMMAEGLFVGSEYHA